MSLLASLNSAAQETGGRGGGGRLPRVEALFDAGDYYLFQDRSAVPLLRSGREIALKRSKSLPQETVSAVVAADSILLSTDAPGGPDQGTLEIYAAEDASQAVQTLAGVDGIHWVSPVMASSESGSRVLITDEVIVRPKLEARSAELEEEFAKRGFEVVAYPAAHSPSYLLVHSRRASAELLADVRALMDLPDVAWAEPNFIVEVDLYSIPNDPLFPRQQGLDNWGQNGAVPGLDVDAPAAWDTCTWSEQLVIAIIDTGVDTAHPDLNILINANEVGDGRESNGVDNDGNGYIDDYRGWDFYGNDNNPNPGSSIDAAHGTACAGIAAARGNNSIGVAGAARGCRVLPVKITHDAGVPFATEYGEAQAIRYAAQFADVISCSWGQELPPSSDVLSAIDYAVSSACRYGKGCAVLFASGNDDGMWAPRTQRLPVPIAVAGNYALAFRFISDGGVTDWLVLDQIRLLTANGYDHAPNGQSFLMHEDFELGSGGWVSDPIRDRSSTSIGNWIRTSEFQQRPGSQWCLRGPLADQAPLGEWSEVRSPMLQLQTGNYVVAYVTAANDVWTTQLETWLVDAQGGRTLLGNAVGRGKGTPGVAYPARSAANAIAIGASSDLGLRSYYSSYGPQLFAVAPSNGGWNDAATTDISGPAGKNDGSVDGLPDYTMAFGGTSAATPLTAGVAALLLSKNSQLTVAELKQALRAGCQKIGGVTYDQNGWHQEYGYGQVNAYYSLQSFYADTYPPQVSSAVARTGRAIAITFSEQMGGGALIPGHYTVSGTGQGTLPAHPSSVSWVSGTTFLLEWAGGEMIPGAGNVAITANSGVQDIRGLPVGGPGGSGLVNGSRVVHALSCGWRSPESLQPILPFDSERYWSGSGTLFGSVGWLLSIVNDDGTPRGVYETERAIMHSATYPGEIRYTLPNITAVESYRVKLYFFANGYSGGQPGEVRFDVHLNDVPKLSNFDLIGAAGGPRVGIWREFHGITANASGCIAVKVVPRQTYNQAYGQWFYNATISGIKVTATQPFVTAFTPDPRAALRNDFPGWVGLRFQVGSAPITVAEVGRWVVSGNSQSHTVKIVNSSGVDVPGGAAVVNTSGAPAGQFKYVPLATEVVLNAGQTYFLVSQEFPSGDQWYNHPYTRPTFGPVATMIGPAWTWNSPTQYYYVTTSPPESYGPVSLRY